MFVLNFEFKLSLIIIQDLSSFVINYSIIGFAIIYIFNWDSQ